MVGQLASPPVLVALGLAAVLQAGSSWVTRGAEPERDLALVADNSDLVDVWVRLHQGDLPIVWTEGGNRYEPDFVIVEGGGEHLLVEVEADRDLSSNDVRAKRDAAQRWAAYANDGLPPASPRWSYLLVSETDLREAKEDWAALRKLSPSSQGGSRRSRGRRRP